MLNTQFGSKNKIAKTCEKRLYKYITVVLRKKQLKKQLIFEKWEHFENGRKWPQCKDYSPCKILSLAQKIKFPKTCKNISTNTLELFYAKNGSNKHLILQNWKNFENGQKWPQCKGDSPCKILTLAQKIKLPKTCEKTSVQTH